jgi:hypothetical protein
VGDRKVAYRVLVGRTDGKRPLGRSRRHWEDNIKIDYGEAWTGLLWFRIGTGGRLL